MASTKTETLQQEFDRIGAAYEADFAGQSRATRDLKRMGELLSQLRTLIKEAEALPAGAAGSSLLAEAQARLATYENEQQAIKDAKAAGPEYPEFAQLAASANFVFARYFRHFAGKDRGSRDLGLLTEMVEELGAIRQRMSVILVVKPQAAFQRDADLVTRMTEMYKGELREIPKAIAAGTAEEQASKLAGLANAQFDLYRSHFVNHARTTRRPALLQRMIDNLKRTLKAMRELKITGEMAANNKSNISIVEANIRSNEAELAEIRKARQAISLRDIQGQLGGAANEVFEEYRKKFDGKDRRTVDLSVLSLLCDKLGEIARQMADLNRTEPTEMNERNLGIVMEQLAAFEQEYRESHQVQFPAQNPA